VDAAAVLAPDDAHPARLFVVSGRSAGEILGDMRAHIEDFKIPRRCAVLERLPLTRNGKVDRKALSELASRP
jgi:acyl-coenzyme A synthetase/AMP-(fatty) acid ligase